MTERGAALTTAAVTAVSDQEGVRVTGIVPPIPTPFRDGRVDLESLRRHLDDLYESVDGVLVGGSTGEAASLTIEEREAVIRAVTAHFEDHRALVVSITDNAIENSRRLSDVAGECGAHLLVLSCPNYFTNDLSMLESYFGAIAEFASADICLYDNPVASNTLLSVSDIVALIAAAPRLTHIKVTDTALEKVAALRETTNATIFAGDDSVLWHQMIGGAEGAMTAVPMVYPQSSAKMWRAFRAGNREEAYDEYRNLSHFIHCCLSSADYPSVVKVILHHRGVISAPDVRPPLIPLSPSRYAEVVAAY
jgi:4-hydroxy-tetrahydrodipicolinate synthase